MNLQKMLSLEKAGRSCFTVLSALQVPDTYCIYGYTHIHNADTDTSHARAVQTVKEELHLQMCACRLEHVNRTTHIVHRRREIKLFGPNLLPSRGVLKLPAPNNICCSLLPLLSADEEGVPTRGFVNGGKSYKSQLDWLKKM